ncbi:MAG: transposase [Catenulispora sp.]
MSGKGTGRVHLAGMIATKPHVRTRLVYRMQVNRGRRGDPKGFREKDFAQLLDLTHQRLAGPMVLIWDNSTRHVDARMRALIAARPWLTVFQLPAYAPELNPAEGVWAHLKRSIANLAPRGTEQLSVLIGSRLRHLQCRPSAARRLHRRDRPDLQLETTVRVSLSTSAAKVTAGSGR